MRLIDADALKSCYTGSNGLDDKASYGSIRKMIDAQPTAYDVDKVVEQLEYRSTLARPVGWSKSYEIITLDDAIEIVKSGRMNDRGTQ